MKTQMIMPDFFQPAMKESTKIIKKKPTKADEDRLLELSDSDSWRKLKSIIEGKMAALQDMTSKACRKSASIEEWGFRYAILDQTLSAYQSIIDVVELRRKVKEIHDTLEQERTVS